MSKHRRAFSLVELLTAMAVTMLLLAVLGQLVSWSLREIKRSTRSLGNHETVAACLRLLREDLQGLSPHPATTVFFLEQDADFVRLLINRPEARTESLHAQGYIRHVAYIWERDSGDLIRAVYHPARDSAAAASTSASAMNLSVEENLRRLKNLTPAMQGNIASAWQTHPALKAALQRATELPVLSSVNRFQVECDETWEVSANSQTTWQDAQRVPKVVRIRLAVFAEREALPQVFQITIPVQPIAIASP
jgi:type II secretory pathway pseudopilin PulG